MSKLETNTIDTVSGTYTYKLVDVCAHYLGKW